MSLSEWDRDYIEHLIAKDQKAEEEYKAQEAQHAHDQFMGEDRYYWDLHEWPKPDQVKSHHMVMVIPCPECHTRLDISLVAGSVCTTEYRHVRGCEFFRVEQRQWVDDYADLRRGDEVIRGLSETEKALILGMRFNPDHYQMRVEMRDGQLVRIPLEMPPLPPPLGSFIS